MELRTALYIYLPLDANAEEIEAAHNIIDGQFGTNPQTIVSNNIAPGVIANAPAAAPAASATGPSPAGAEGFDVTGLPWDERIHSSNRKKNDKGGWWAKRGVDASYRAKIETELRNSIGAAPIVTHQETPAAITLPPVAGAGLPPIPGANVPDPAYTALVQLIAQNTHSPANPNGRLTDEWVKQLLAAYNVPDGSLQNLAHAPQLVGPIAEYLATALAS